MNPEELERAVVETAIVIDILERSEPIDIELSGDMAYLLLCQLQIAFESTFHRDVGIPSDLWEFYKALEGEIVERCPQVIPFLPKYDLQNSEEN